MVEAKFIFITPSQYNRIYSVSSGIMINQKMNDDTAYLSEEIKIRDQRITQLESVIKDMGESLWFYAGEENWNSKKYRDGALMLFEELGGERARETLSKHKYLLDQLTAQAEKGRG